MPKGSGARGRGSANNKANVYTAPHVNPAEILLHRLVIQAAQNNVGMVMDILLNEPELPAPPVAPAVQPSCQPPLVDLLARAFIDHLRELARADQKTRLLVKLRAFWPAMFGGEPCSPNGKGNGTHFEQFDSSSQTDLQNVPLAYLVDKYDMDEQTATALEENLSVIYLRDMLRWKPLDFAAPWARHRIGPSRTKQLRRIVTDILPASAALPYLDRIDAMGGRGCCDLPGD